MSGFFFRISKTQNLSIDLNIELYVSVIALYDEDTVSTVRVEIWKENICGNDITSINNMSK